MPEKHDESFRQQRNEAFDRVIALVETRLKSALPPLLLDFHEMSPEKSRAAAEHAAWSLFLHGVKHLKEGAPGGQPGSMTEALSRVSLRSGAFAAALGVRPPQFEQMYFSVDYATGHEAALFYCRRLAEAAGGDLLKSRQIIQQRILAEKPAGTADADTLKRQMALSFDVLADAYGRICREFAAELSGLAAPEIRP